MKDFRDKVAVITGAASGIGRALATRAAREGLKVVLAGVNQDTLDKAERELREEGATTLSVRTDVSNEGDVKALARRTVDTFGSVDLLFNNAGIGCGTTIWESTLEDWQWILGVNLWGVIYGVRVFVPLMLAQDTECHIVNTASIAGIVSPPNLGLYSVTKHGVVALSEALSGQLGERKAKVKVSVLCPAFVRTSLSDAERNRPPRYRTGPAARRLTPQEIDAGWDRAGASTGSTVLTADQVADRTFEAIRKDQLFILTHPESKTWVRARTRDIINERSPAVPG